MPSDSMERGLTGGLLPPFWGRKEGLMWGSRAVYCVHTQYVQIKRTDDEKSNVCFRIKANSLAQKSSLKKSSNLRSDIAFYHHLRSSDFYAE